jgi:hypothetical protein
MEAVFLGKYFGQLRQGFFGAIFFIAADEDDVPFLPRASAAREREPGIIGPRGAGD